MPTEGLFAFRKCLQAPGTKVRGGSGVARWRQWGGLCEPSERKRISPLAPPVLEGDKATPFHSQGKNKRFCSQCLSIPCWKSPSSSGGDSERDPRAGLSQLRHPAPRAASPHPVPLHGPCSGHTMAQDARNSCFKHPRVPSRAGSGCRCSSCRCSLSVPLEKPRNRCSEPLWL